MPNNKKLSSINLVPQDEFDTSVIGKSLKWALTTGKSIVILTEFVVILAFLSRFKLDQDLNDLNEQISQKTGLVDAFSEVEQQMLDVQARMTLVGEIKNTSVNVTASMDQVSQMVPLDTKLDTFELNQGGWILKGTASSEGSFATLMSRLENSGKFTTIDVGDVRYDLRKGGLVFSVETTFPKVNAPKAAAPARRATPTPKEET